MNERLTGMLLVISGPSGVGKGTIVKQLMSRDPSIVFSVSATTRAPREGEVDHRDYHFVTEEEYDRLLKEDAFLEHAEVHAHRYGTLKSEVEERIARGQNVLLDIDTQGALQVMEKAPDAVSVFILPPSFQELERRLRGRQTETEADIRRRLSNARHEVLLLPRYTYALVNDDLEQACRTLESIVRAEKQKTSRLSIQLDEEYTVCGLIRAECGHKGYA